MRFSAADDSTEQPVPTHNREAGQRRCVDHYFREYHYETSELPESTMLRYLLAWPQVGLDATIVELDLPDPRVLRDNILTLT